MPYSAIAIANYFIEKSLEAKDASLTPMKLQKLVYFAHAWYLALTADSGNAQPLINDRIGAWPFGPVISSLYKKFAHFAKKNITELGKDQFGNVLTVDDSEVRKFLDRIWEVYGKLSASDLSGLTHTKDSPWAAVYKDGESNVISNDSIKNYYIRFIS